MAADFLQTRVTVKTFTEALAQVIPHTLGVTSLVFLLNGFHHGQRRSTGQRIAAVSRAMITRFQHFRGSTTGQAGTNRYTITQAFGGGYNIGHKTEMLVAEILTGAAVAGLHFI